MSNNENSSQQPGLAPFSYGFNPNQMQQFYPPASLNQLAGMPFNALPSAPQMMPNFPTYFHPYQPMIGGMPQQMFNPMQFAGAQLGPGPMQPPMAPPMDQNQPAMGPPPPTADQMVPPGQMMHQMGSQMAMLAPGMGGPMMPHFGGGSMQMMAGLAPGMPGMGHPGMPPGAIFMGSGGVPYMIMQMPVIFPPNVPIPAPIPIKREIKEEEDESIVECTPVHIAQRNNFSIARILEPDEVKKEPVDQQDAAVPKTPARSRATNLVETRVPPAIPAQSLPPASLLPPSPIIPVPSRPVSPDEMPETPASPDCRHDRSGTVDQDTKMIPSQLVVVDRVDPAVAQSFQAEDPSREENQLIGSDEYLSNDETGYHSAAGHSFPPPHSSTPSFALGPPLDATSDPMVIAHSDESVISHGDIRLEFEKMNEQRSKWEEEEEDNGVRADDAYLGLPPAAAAAVSNESPPEFQVFRNGSESPEQRPSVPPRFAVRRNRSETPERPPSVPPRYANRRPARDERRSRSRSRSKSPVRRWREQSRSRSPPQSSRGRGSERVVVVRGVPARLDEERIRRFFKENYGKCRLTRVRGETGAVRIEFDSKRDREKLKHTRSVTISREILTLHDEFVETSESRESVASSRVARVLSPIRGGQSAEEMAAMVRGEAPLALERHLTKCEKFKKEIILTAGPIPRGCSAMSVIDYFRRQQCHVLDVPFPTHRPHEYLVLRVDNIGQAKRVMAAQEHRVGEHIIDVSPPFDVHLKLNGMGGMEQEAMELLQEQCGVLVSLPSICYTGKGYMFGYVSFGRPQDGQAAISKGVFSLRGREFKVAQSDCNASFKLFEAVWDAKCALEKMARKMADEKAKSGWSEESRGGTKKKRRNVVKDVFMEDDTVPILTVGPIPENCKAEADEYLLSTFDDVYSMPNPMPDHRHFRLLALHDPLEATDLLKEGYVRVGGKQERVLVSPPFDVTFKSSNKTWMDGRQLEDHMQRKYGPIVRRSHAKHGIIKMTFGRMQDAMKAIQESPHFKSLNVQAHESRPNYSFAHFAASVNLPEFLSRAKDAEIMELAADIRVECRPETAASSESVSKRDLKRQHEDSDDDVLVCSPVKKARVEERKLSVRVSDPERWIPDKPSIMRHFNQFGRVAAFQFVDHLEAVVEFEDGKQAQKALATPHVKVGGLWVDVAIFDEDSHPSNR